MSNQEIIKKQRSISKELKTLSYELEKKGVINFHNLARCEINKKYGKGWKEDLEFIKTHSFIKMNYY